MCTIKPEQLIITITGRCRHCNKQINITVNKSDWEAYKSGKLLTQKAFPYLSADDREFILSQICGDCWDTIFAEDMDDYLNNMPTN